MIESVIALLMYMGVTIQEHVPFESLGECLEYKRKAERSMGTDGPRLACLPVKAEIEIWKEDGKKHIIRIIEE
tara:strand:+ start:1182 stop:1400 length:219 start_codon:yes stop_codon:yes gene_type:complete